MVLKLKLVFRKILKSGVFTYLNVLSLAISITAILTIYSYIDSELKTDTQFTDKDEIFRLVRTVSENGSSYRTPMLAGPYRDLLTDAARLSANSILRIYEDDELVSYLENTFFEPNFFYVDENFFDFFDYSFQVGSSTNALAQPNSVVITREIAEKYFGDNNPMGKVLEIQDKEPLVVSGVLKDFSSKSHLNFDFIVNNKSIGYAKKIFNDKSTHSMAFYLKIPEKDISIIESSLADLSNQYFNSKSNDKKLRFQLQNLTDIYFDDPLVSDMAKHGNISTIKSLTILAFVICILIITNFINVTIAKRTKELSGIGLKKVLGSSKMGLVMEWLLEVYFLVFSATVIGFVLYNILFSTFFENVFGVSMVFTQTLELLVPALVFSVVLTAFIVLPPMLIFTNTPAFSALSGKLNGVKTNAFQYSLLFFQFIAAFVLISFTIVVKEQFDFMQKKEIGLNSDQILLFDSNNKNSWKNKDFIKNEIKSLSGVTDVSLIYGGIPSSETESVSYEINDLLFQWNTAYFEPNTMAMLDLKLVSGKGFDPEIFAENAEGVVLNTAAAKLLGWPQEKITGTKISLLEEKKDKRILGIVKDYQYESFKDIINPLVMQSNDYGETFMVKLNVTNFENTLTKINTIWKDYVPKYPFSYRFLDETFESVFAEDTKQGKIIYLFTFLTILIAAIGTLSLSSFILQLKIKEFAVRKVLGSSQLNLFLALSSKIIKTLLYSCIVGLPIGWYFIKSWLNNFGYKINTSPLFFAAGFAVLGGIILSLVFIQSRKVLLRNPVHSLKNH